MKIIVFVSLLFFIFTAPAHAQVVISEVYPAPTSEEKEWVELYNTSNESVNIANWKLFEHYSSKKELVLFQDVTIEPKSFFIFELESNKINNIEEEITLENLDNEEVSSLYFTNSESGKSFSYMFLDEDSISDLLELNTPTKGTINQIIPASTPTPSSSPTPTITPTSSPQTSPTPSPTNTSNITTNNETQQKTDNTQKLEPVNYKLKKYMEINQKLLLPETKRIEKEGFIKPLPQFSYIVQKNVSKQGVINAIIGGTLIIFIGFIL